MVRVRVKIMVRDRVRVRVRIFSIFRRCAICVVPNRLQKTFGTCWQESVSRDV